MRFDPRRLVPVAGLLVLACNSDAGPENPTAPTPNFSCTIPQSRLFDGGVGRDGIPALTQPDVELIGNSRLSADTRVLGVVINDVARAYPLPILWWHEIVNDELGGVPVIVSYCPLTGSGLAFDPVIGGETRNFGVSGLLFENNLVMFDRQTESLWNQLLMGAQCGPESGTELRRLPVVETTLGRWRKLHPRSTVLSDDTGFDRSYGVYPYGDYDLPDNDVTLYPSSAWSDERPPKELVLGIREGGASAAYPFGALADMGEVVALNDTVGNRPVLITYHADASTAIAYDRSVDGQTLTFEVANATTSTFTDSETGTEWNAAGDAIAGPLAGSRLSRLEDAFTLFWFAWSVYYPDTQLPLQ